MELEQNDSLSQSVSQVVSEVMKAAFHASEVTEEHPLITFLLKIYIGNANSSKCTKSVRLKRFSAFLYRACSNYPSSPFANDIIQNTLIAVLTNCKNNWEDQDESIVASIVRWTSVLLLRTVEQKFLDSAFDLLKYLVEGLIPPFLSFESFQQQLKSDSYFLTISLTPQDENNAITNRKVFSFSSAFDLRKSILLELNFKKIFGLLYSYVDQKNDVLKLFHLFSEQIPQKQSSSLLFKQIFLTQTPSSSIEISAIIDALDEGNIPHQNARAILWDLISKQDNSSLYFELILVDSPSTELFLQLLNEYWSKENIQDLINSFLTTPIIQNSSIVSLLINSNQIVSEGYLELLFNQLKLEFRHSIIIGLALLNHKCIQLGLNIIEQLCKCYDLLDIQKKTLIFKAIHFSFSKNHKKQLQSFNFRLQYLQQLSGPPSLSFLQSSELRGGQISKAAKDKLAKLLINYEDPEYDAERIKIELLQMCNYPYKRGDSYRKYMKSVKDPINLKLRTLKKQTVAQDPKLVAIILMSINNLFSFSIIEHISEPILNHLFQIYISLHQNLGRQFVTLEYQRPSQQIKRYYCKLFRHGLYTEKKHGNKDGEVGELLSGQYKYKRLNYSNLSNYLVYISGDNPLSSWNWICKIIAVQLRALLRKIFYNIGSGSGITNMVVYQKIQNLFHDKWLYYSAFELIQAYFQAHIDDSDILKELLGLFTPQYKYFGIVEDIFTTMGHHYVDILYYTPQFLRQIYWEMMDFLEELVQSLPHVPEKTVLLSDTALRSTKIKNASIIEVDSDFIFNNAAFFRNLILRNQLASLFGNPQLLVTFRPILRIVQRLENSNLIQMRQVEAIPEVWFSHLKMYYKPYDKQWKEKLESYCDLLLLFIVKQKFKLSNSSIERNVQALGEILVEITNQNSNKSEITEKILTTILLIYQASLPNQPPQVSMLPTQQLKTQLLNFHLEPPEVQDYFRCFTCNSYTFCRSCIQFLHRYHDFNYIGKSNICRNASKHPKKQAIKNNSHNLAASLSTSIRPFNADANQLIGGLQTSIGSAFTYISSSITNAILGQNYSIMPTQRLSYRDQSVQISHQNIQVPQIVNNEERPQQRPVLILDQHNDDSQLEIKSSSQRQLKKLCDYSWERQTIQLQFDPLPEVKYSYPVGINMTPLRYSLLKDIQTYKVQSQQFIQIGNLSVIYLKQQYQFFRQPYYFRDNGTMIDPHFSRGITLRKIKPTPPNFFASNGHLLIFPSFGSNIQILSIEKIASKLKLRVDNKMVNYIQVQHVYNCGQIMHSKINFEPTFLVFNNRKPDILAVVGASNIGFGIIQKNGKVRRYINSKIILKKPISKFVWLQRQADTYAISLQTNIRFGYIKKSLQSKIQRGLKIKIDKNIKDFTIKNEDKLIVAYIIDVDGDLYRAEFDQDSPFAETKGVKVKLPQNVKKLLSLIIVDKKMLLSSQNGECHLLIIDAVRKRLKYIQTYSLRRALRDHNVLASIMLPIYFTQLKLIQRNTDIFSIGCIAKTSPQDPKNKGGYLFVFRINHKNDLDVICLQNEPIVECFEVIIVEEKSYMLFALQTNNNVNCYHYKISEKIYYNLDDSCIFMDINNLGTLKKCVRNNKLLDLIKHYDPKRCRNFKDDEDISIQYQFKVVYPESIKVSKFEGNRHFWTGITFDIITKKSSAKIQFELLGQSYSFQVSGYRQIQIPFNIKQTLKIYLNDCELFFAFKTNAQSVKNLKIYGIINTRDSVYRKALQNLHYIVMNSLLSNKCSVDYYMESSSRYDIRRLNVSEFKKLKTKYGYTERQLNLFMRVQLLRESLEKNMKQHEIQQTFETIYQFLLPVAYTRRLLHNSFIKLIKRLCHIALPLNNGLLGHPFQYNTIMDIYYFEMLHNQWKDSFLLEHYEELIKYLYTLIFKRVGNLYIILGLNPNLISDLIKSRIIHQEQARKNVNIYTMLLALICEQYQVLKNNQSRMTEQANEALSLQRIILDLLQQLSQASITSKHYLSPQIYFERMLLIPKNRQILQSYLKTFSIYKKQEKKIQKNVQQCFEEESSFEDNYKVEDSDVQPQLKQFVEPEQENQMIARQFQSNIYSPQIIEYQTYDQLHPPFCPDLITIKDDMMTYLKQSYIPEQITYYQFTFEMATAFFKFDDCFTQTNKVFYIKTFFSILRVIQMRMQPERDMQYLDQFFKAVLIRIQSSSHSLLFMVLNYFIEPTYGPWKKGEKRNITSSKSRIAQQFAKFLNKQSIFIEDQIMKFEVIKWENVISFEEIKQSDQYSIENDLYQLMFLCNLYFSADHKNNSAIEENDLFKCKIIKEYMVFKLRVLLNIMLAEGWQQDIQIRVVVGFEILKCDQIWGINCLYDLSKTHPIIFAYKLEQDPTKIETLQELANLKSSQLIKVMEMLTVYNNN